MFQYTPHGSLIQKVGRSFPTYTQTARIMAPFVYYSTRSDRRGKTHYENLGVSRSANDADIKKKFRELSKKYHPDIVNSGKNEMSEEERKYCNERFIDLVASYEILKDKTKRADYDRIHLKGEISNVDRSNERRDFQNRYYGESNTYTTRSGLNTSRNRVHYGDQSPNYQRQGDTYFNGQWRDHSRHDDVPHFDYFKHLAKNIDIDRRFNNTRAEYHSNSLFSHNNTNSHSSNNRYLKNKKRSTSTTTN